MLKKYYNNNLNNDLIRNGYHNNNFKKNLKNNDKFSENKFQEKKIKKIDLINKESLINNNHNELIKNLTEELFNKDKKLQEFKNEIESFSKKYNNLNNEKEKFHSNENEIYLLKKKLNEQYKINNNLKKFEENYENEIKEKEKLNHKITELNIIIIKQKCEMVKLINEKNKFYKNKKLKDILLKYDFNENEINEKFIEFKITSDMDITKDLIQKLIHMK